ncbi:MAG: hypothetical protein GX148_01455 [Clostridiales bacterium]|jgi:hypothetical protein|nr:hypothetical protein [Clostridiales bacterium]
MYHWFKQTTCSGIYRSEIYGCADWQAEKTEKGYVATALACKLCALSKKSGGANPCNGWCLDPMIAMLCEAGGVKETDIEINSTLMDADCCKITVKLNE